MLRMEQVTEKEDAVITRNRVSSPLLFRPPTVQSRSLAPQDSSCKNCPSRCAHASGHPPNPSLGYCSFSMLPLVDVNQILINRLNFGYNCRDRNTMSCINKYVNFRTLIPSAANSLHSAAWIAGQSRLLRLKECTLIIDRLNNSPPGSMLEIVRCL
jgi:hypothetical protein